MFNQQRKQAARVLIISACLCDALTAATEALATIQMNKGVINPAIIAEEALNQIDELLQKAEDAKHGI